MAFVEHFEINIVIKKGIKIMLNKEPIFIIAFARGGSTIIMNLLLSHPNVCLSNGETHKVFKGTRWDTMGMKMYKKLMCDLPIRIITRQNYFSPRLLKERKKVPQFLREYIDSILYEGRFKAPMETHNLFKDETQHYTNEELSQARLLTKALNGLVFTMETFSEMYPDATFFSLIRNGLAMSEGYIRRGINAESAAHIFKTICDKMVENSKTIPNYHIVKFEDMLSEPAQFTEKIFKLANLNGNQVPKIRQQTRKTINAEGKHILEKGSEERQVYWYLPSELKNHMSPDINKNQLKRLSQQDKNTFLSIAGETMEKVGYSV